MNDDANPQGIPRPPLASKKVYQDDPVTKRTMYSVHAKSKAGGRPMLDTNMAAVGEGNNPQGTPRPDGKSLGKYMGSVVSRGVYNQADEI